MSIAKRYVTELASDFKKYVQKTQKEADHELPQGFLLEVWKVKRNVLNGIVTNREAAERILEIWRMFDDAVFYDSCHR